HGVGLATVGEGRPKYGRLDAEAGGVQVEFLLGMIRFVDGGVARGACLGFEAYTEAVGREADAAQLDRDPMRYLHLGEREDQVRPHLPEVLSSERLCHDTLTIFPSCTVTWAYHFRS